VTLLQLNLKLTPGVAAHWRREAAAAGLSVRDWLIRQTMPGDPPAALSLPPPADDLANRVGELERLVGELLTREPAPSPRRRREAPAPSPLPLPPSGDAPPDEAIPSADLARLLGMKRNAFNARLRRAGGARVGMVEEGWRCVGIFPHPTGGPPRPWWLPDRVPEQVPGT
jgi:hypothetical protein